MSALIEAPSRIRPERQVVTDNLQRLAYGTSRSGQAAVTDSVLALIAEGFATGKIGGIAAMNCGLGRRALILKIPGINQS
jgi:hypothetical protein